MEKKVKRNLQYTVQVVEHEVRIYTRTTKEEDFELCVAFPIIGEKGTATTVSTNFAFKVIELANLGYKQVP